MSQDKIEVSFKCGKCGSRLSWADDSTDDTEVKCNDCGEVAGTYGELHEAAMSAAKSKVESMFSDIFKKR